MRLASLLMFIVLLSTNAAAEVSLQCTYYNSFDYMTTDMIGDNLEFEGFTRLMPTSLLYKSVGKSTGSDCSYSYDMCLNGDRQYSGADTDSGGFSWSGIINRDDAEGDSGTFDLSASSMVKDDGVLRAYCGNSDIKVEYYVETNEAFFVQNAKITKDLSSFKGSGSTIPDSHGDDISDDDEVLQDTLTIKGFKELIRVDAGDTQGQIEVNVEGETESLWRDKVEGDASGYTFGMEAKGVCKNTMDELEMLGKASDFPQVRLPPGNVSVDVHYEDEYDKYLQDYLDFIGETYEEFCEDYPQKENSLIWYLLNQEAYVNPIEGEGPNENDPPEEIDYYRMKMTFSVGYM